MGSSEVVNYHSLKHQELAQQLSSWWGAQTRFKTKKEFAAVLKVHPDTLGDYLAGRKFPKLDIATRLCELTDLACLRAGARAGSVSVKAPQAPSPLPLPRSAPGVAASREKPSEPDIKGATLSPRAGQTLKHQELAEQLSSWLNWHPPGSRDQPLSSLKCWRLYPASLSGCGGFLSWCHS